MSMNIAFEASRVIRIVETDITETQRDIYTPWQTPTEDSRKIANSPDPVQAYKDWVLSQSDECVFEQEIFAEDDIWCEKGPIAWQLHDPRTAEVKRFEDWIENAASGAWKVKAIIV